MNVWLEKEFLPSLSTGQTVIMDNATFHKSKTTQTLIEERGCTLLYLPTYSPDLNPIEEQWAILKARIRKHKPPQQPLEAALTNIFKLYG